MLMTLDEMNIIPQSEETTVKSFVLKEKQNLLELKDTLGLQNDGILDTNLMPQFNKAWERSFDRVDKNKNAISDRE